MPWSAFYEKNNQWDVLKPMYCDDNNLHLSVKCTMQFLHTNRKKKNRKLRKGELDKNMVLHFNMAISIICEFNSNDTNIRLQRRFINKIITSQHSNNL